MNGLAAKEYKKALVELSTSGVHNGRVSWQLTVVLEFVRGVSSDPPDTPSDRRGSIPSIVVSGKSSFKNHIKKMGFPYLRGGERRE